MNQDTTKAQFFAQYYGVDGIAFSDGYEQAFTVSTITINSENEYLLLRSISDLTDEHIRIILDELRYEGFEIEEKNIDGQVLKIRLVHNIASLHVINVTLYLGGILTFNYDDIYYRHYGEKDCTICNNILMKLGYLLKFTYLDETNNPITLSTDELINLGWVKIKEK